MRTERRGRPVGTTIAYGVLVILVVWSLFPIYWMVVTSLKHDAEIYTVRTTLVPAHPTLEHYVSVVTRGPFPSQLRNSFLIAGGTTLIAMVAGALGGYSIARLRYRGRVLWARSLIASYLVPPAVLFIPLFQLLQSLRLLNTIGGLILTDLTITVPFCTWLLIAYFKTVPIELEDAAQIDGCTRLSTLRRITLPLSAPALVVVALFAFTVSWNEFLYAIVFTTDPHVQPVTAGLTGMIQEDVFFWGKMMAAATLAAIPPVVLYYVGQRWVVQGLAVGAVKG